MGYHLITTDHLTDNLLFRDNEDFRCAMNYVATTAYTLKVTVLCFILMSNHVHFVVTGSREEAKTFIDRFKLVYGKHFQNKYASKEFLRKLGVDIREVRVEDESLHRGIAYVQMNCVAANITPHPALYPWGTGASFFSEAVHTGTPLSTLSGRVVTRLLHSFIRLPGDYRIGEGGYILPESYVAGKYVESLFRSARRYAYFLNTSSKSRLHLEKEAAPSFRDQVILEAATDLCHSLYRSRSFKDLDEGQKAGLMQQLRRRFNPDINQLVRVMGMPYADVAGMLDTFL